LRLLLDAHVSGARIATALRERGHDVRAADEERELDGWADEALLALAAEEERVLVTFDVKDFPDIARRWAEAARPHAGCAIVVGIDHSEFGTILRALDGLLEERSEQEDWREYTCFVSRGDPARGD
jgi:predicted nuclease of predicted toxin-antitoxin system